MGAIRDLGRAYLLGPSATPGYQPDKTDGVVLFDTMSDMMDVALSTAATAAAQSGETASVGEVATSVRALNLVPTISGVTAVLGSDGYPSGFTVAAGSVGAWAYIASYPLTDQDAISALSGKTLLFTAVYDATSGFLADLPLSSVHLIDVGRNLGVSGGTLVSEAQVGTKITRLISYVVSGSEAAIGVKATISSAATAKTANKTLALSSLTYRVVTTAGASPAGETIAMAIRDRASGRGGVSLMADAYEPTGTVASGVSWLRDPRTNYIAGWSIPPGIAGGLTFFSWVWYPSKTDFHLIRGANARFTIVFEVSAGYDRIITPTVYSLGRPSGGGSLTNHRVVAQYRDSTHRAYVVDGVISSSAEQIVVGIQNAAPVDGVAVGDVITATTDTLRLVDVILEIVEAPTAGRSGTAAHLSLNRSIASRVDGAAQPINIVTVAPSGGDFSTIAAAIAASVPDTRFEISGVLTGGESASPLFYPTIDRQKFTGLPGATVALAQAADATLAGITVNSTCDLHYSNALRGLRMTAQNARYVIHSDAMGTIYNRHQIIEDCDLEHLGNETAGAYWAGHGHSSGEVWSSCSAVGAGLGSGSTMVIRRSRLRGYAFDAFHGHNWADASEPTSVVIEECTLDPQDSTGASAAFYWANIGSGQNDSVRLVGNRFGGPLKFGSWPWQITDPARIPANKMTTNVVGYGNTVAPVVIEDDGSRALRIDSATTGASSSVTVSGTAATALFGGSVTVRGAVGLAGGVYGLLDVGDHAVGPSADQNVTQLGKRLGDCSTTSKILTVLIDGSTTKTVTFSTDLRSASNTTILASINSALGASATTSLMDVNALFRPMISDEETSVYNAGSTTILRRMAVAWASSGRPQGRVMTSADAERLFAGIAYEDIRPGEWGRVKVEGAVRVSVDLLRSDSGSFGEGDYFGVGSTAGMWVKSPAVPLLVAVNALDVAIPDRFELDAAGAWASFSPAVTSQTGTITTASATGRYRKVGRVVHFEVNATITTNGTGSSAVVIGNLPVNSSAVYNFIGRENVATGKAILGTMNPSTGYIICTFYDNTYPGADGRSFTVSGSYEAA